MAHIPTANGTAMTGATSLVKSLEAANVEVMFGLPGGAILPAYGRSTINKLFNVKIDGCVRICNPDRTEPYRLNV